MYKGVRGKCLLTDVCEGVSAMHFKNLAVKGIRVQFCSTFHCHASEACAKSCSGWGGGTVMEPSPPK